MWRYGRAWEGCGVKLGVRRRRAKGIGQEGRKTIAFFPYLPLPPQRLPFFPSHARNHLHTHTHTHARAHNRTPLYLLFFSLSRPFLFLSFLPSSHSFLSFFLSLSFRGHGFVHHATCAWVSLLGPCFKTGRTRRFMGFVRHLERAQAPTEKMLRFSCSRGCSFSFSTATAREREGGARGDRSEEGGEQS